MDIQDNDPSTWTLLRRWAAKRPLRTAVLATFAVTWNGIMLWSGLQREHVDTETVDLCLLAVVFGIMAAGFMLLAVFHRELVRVDEAINPLTRWWAHPSQRPGNLQFAR